MTYMSGTKALIERITVNLRSDRTGNIMPVYIDVFDNSLSRKWITALNALLANANHLEKNYSWFGFVESPRTIEVLCDKINASISAINSANLGYQIAEHFTRSNSLKQGIPGADSEGQRIEHDKFNRLHRCFEDLQGVSGAMSPYWTAADAVTRWHIRQLNLLCHEFESLAISLAKAEFAPEWRRPSQLMCFLNSPRFVLAEQDLDLFGIETINRPLGGVFVGVNKAVGKHHWEVFMDEGKHGKMLDELTTISMRGQTEAAGDFDIEWANNPGAYDWQIRRLAQFREWLVANGIDPEDRALTIGHPQVGQVDLVDSFSTEDYRSIWAQLGAHLNVHSIRTSTQACEYHYNWTDADYMEQQIRCLG